MDTWKCPSCKADMLVKIDRDVPPRGKYSVYRCFHCDKTFDEVVIAPKEVLYEKV